jgi:phospholipid transport system substrate-binding protein
MRKRCWNILSISLALAICCSAATAARAQGPTDYVRGLMDKVMAIQTDPALAGPAHESERGRLIHQIIGRTFDFPVMAKDSLGGAYGRLSSGQRQEFLNTFSYLFQDSYTRMVLKFLQKENIKYYREKAEGSKARVETAIVRPNETIPVTYLMHQAAGGWLLYDVIVDGVSILQNYRTQFSRVIQSKGFSFLLNRMELQRRALK